MITNLKDLDLMTFPEASTRWNKERSYVIHQYLKYRHKFLEGSTAAVGNGQKPVYVITREGMEYLMQQTEQEANKGLWMVRRHKDWTYITFEQRVDSEAEARDLITQLIYEESKKMDQQLTFEVFQKNPIKVRVNLTKNVTFTYEKIKKRKD